VELEAAVLEARQQAARAEALQSACTQLHAGIAALHSDHDQGACPPL
jgi:hypothetical protein